MTVLRRPRLQREEGFTLIELLIAMMVLSVGVLALVAAYSSSYASMNRATVTSSATFVADSKMERYRARTYANIQLNTSCGAVCSQDATYTGDSAYSAPAQVTGCATTDTSCLPTQTKVGPDGRSYRVDTFIEYACATGTLSTSPSVSCSTGVTPVKLITVVVRNSALAQPVREQSTFTSITGL